MTTAQKAEKVPQEKVTEPGRDLASLTVHQEDMLRRYLVFKSSFSIWLVIDRAIHNSNLPAKFDAIALVRFAVSKGWRLTEEGTALARREMFLQSAPPYSEQTPGNYIPWTEAVARMMEQIELSKPAIDKRRAMINRLNRAIKKGIVRARGEYKGKRQIELVSLNAFILSETLKEQARADTADAKNPHEKLVIRQARQGMKQANRVKF